MSLFGRVLVIGNQDLVESRLFILCSVFAVWDRELFLALLDGCFIPRIVVGWSYSSINGQNAPRLEF